MLFNKVSDAVQSDLVNSMTFKDLWNEIQGLSSSVGRYHRLCATVSTVKKYRGTR